ncbi:MAG: ABC transporter substrate-binding protein, partial [Chloroflexota bacterium]
MKRINLFLVIVMLASILAACGSPAEPAADDGAAAPDTAEEAAAEESSDGAMAVEGEPYVDHLFATVADYEAATGNTLEFSESPMMTAMVDSGDLPAVADRLPAEPGVVRPRDAIGQFGGQVRVIGFYEGAGAFSGLTEGMQQGFFMLDPNYAAYHANIAKGWELSEDGMSLTIHLREGMKWSDGDDFTTEDIRFWHEEIVQNAEIMPNISDSLMPGGELMGLNVIDDYSFEFTFSIPYYRAVEVFAGGEYYAASHALQQYMPTYNEDAEALAEEQGYESWQQAFQFHAGTSDDYYDRDTTMPTLNPWIISEIGADSVLWTRNPYYWRVDIAGNQLPYMDEVLVIMTENVNATAPVKSLA